MQVRVKSLKFDADQKLLDLIEKKVSKLERFDESLSEVEVVLSLLERPENKQVKLHAEVRSATLVIERQAKTFEEALNDCVDAMKEKLTRHREKRDDI